VKPGVIYYNMGTKNLGRLCVSLYTLRKVYDGPVAVLCREFPPRWFRVFLRAMKAERIRIDLGERSALTGKAALWRHSPFDPTLYLDADTVVLGNPESIMPQADGPGFVVTQFCNWVTNGRRIGDRIRALAPVLTAKQVQQAIDYGPAVNTGVMAWRKDCKLLPAWEKLALAAWKKKCMRRMVDELACQVLLPQFADDVSVIMDDCNWSPKFSQEYPEERPTIVHYHGYKHVHPYPMCVYWKCIWHELRQKYDIKPNGDRRLTRYVEELPDGLTLCCVVNEKYARKFNENLVKWRQTDGLADKHLIVFRVGGVKVLDLPNSRYVDIPANPGALTDREYCLQQWVHGPAEHVRTSHWMKLDADCTPKSDEFKIPPYHGHAITAHRWGYTRVKGDPNARKHWLNTLDDWYWGKPVNFPKNIPLQERYRHERTASYCAIYQTSFTRQVALKCPERLPVPSEDTVTDYLAKQWHLPVHRYNAKRWLTA